MPRTPTEADPRSIVAQSRLDEDPRLKHVGGLCVRDGFPQSAGHAYMLEDQTFTERVQNFKQPGTCIHCHGSVYVPCKKAGGGDLIKGFEHFNQMPYADARKSFTHPVACIDCHAPDTMALRITRPGFIGASGRSRRVKASRTTTSTRRRREQEIGLCLRSMPRRVLLQGPGKAIDLSLGQGPQGRADLRVLREVGSPTGRTDRHAEPQGAAS